MPPNTRAYPDRTARRRQARTSRHVVDRRDELGEAAPADERRVAVEIVYRRPVEFVVAWGDQRVRFTASDGIPEEAPSVVERALVHLGLTSIHGL